MLVRSGTSGYSYDAWKGSFYPEDLKKDQFLAYYAEQLPAVEINNTFYRMPSEKMLAAWSDQTPETFQFVLKVSRRVTHFKRLKDCESELEYLLETALTLGPRLGPLLFQLPPNFKKDTARLASFLEIVPPKCRAAFEFRHQSWFDEETHDLLRGHEGATLCIAETEADQWPEIPITSDWGYLRLRREYTEAEVEAWSARILEQPWTEAFAFFKHDDGDSPRLAKLLGSIV